MSIKNTIPSRIARKGKIGTFVVLLMVVLSLPAPYSTVSTVSAASDSPDSAYYGFEDGTNQNWTTGSPLTVSTNSINGSYSIYADTTAVNDESHFIDSPHKYEEFNVSVAHQYGGYFGYQEGIIKFGNYTFNHDPSSDGMKISGPDGSIVTGSVSSSKGDDVRYVVGLTHTENG